MRWKHYAPADNRGVSLNLCVLISQYMWLVHPIQHTSLFTNRTANSNEGTERHISVHRITGATS